MTALLSIKPQYATASFSGEKQFEFRRTSFRRPVCRVIVYVTHPIGLVLGEFDVRGIIEADPAMLWNRTCDAAGIDRAACFDYFEGRDVGYAIQIGAVRRYRKPFCIASRFGIKPPQSFAYVQN